VSKKFLGDKTPKDIQNRILDILLTWTDKFPELGKIKEAYTMLRTQGVLHEPQKNVIAPSKKLNDNSTLKLMESEKFRRLLQSKNQKDIEAANLMIQNMVRDNDRKSQIQNRRLMDLQSANENSIVLKQMLDELNLNESNEDMLSTMEQVYNQCIKLRPTVLRLAEEEYDSESLSNKIKDTCVAISTAIELYTAILIDKSMPPKIVKEEKFMSTNLLDVAEIQQKKEEAESFNELTDIFLTTTISSPQIDNMLLTPQILPSSSTMALINKPAEDFLSNLNDPSSAIGKTNDESKKTKNLSELDSIVSGMKTRLLINADDKTTTKHIVERNFEDDDVNLIDDEDVSKNEAPIIENVKDLFEADQKVALKDINLKISEIQPSETEAPRIIFDEKKGLKVVVNFCQENPAKDVMVLVITIVNQGPIAINNFQFDASVTKPCKLRILEASDRKLPGVKPFKPPTETINQVLLLLNPTQKPINMVAILTYDLKDDPDPYKEFIEVKNIPFNC
jgi:ADP-ribosylation factor-binding protein GGA